MPIPSESEKVNVEFPYEWENPVEGATVTYQMKLIHNEFGAVLQIFQGAYEPIELPATMFLEVTEFLVRKGYMKGMPMLQTKNGISGGSLPVPTIKKTRLGPGANSPIGMPKLGVQSLPQSTNEPSGQIMLRPETSQEDAGAAQIAAVSSDKPEAEPISPEEAQKILQARLAAKAKANTTGKKIRPNPKYEESKGE